MENKPKFTSGPWRKMAWGETISIDGAEIMGLAFLNPRGNHNAGIPSAEDSANASLISAAPEMYEALRQCENVIGMARLQGKLSDSGLSPVNNALLAARAALKKAEGQP